MANAVYPKAKESMLSPGIDLSSSTIKAVLVTSGYTYSSSHQFLSDVGAGTRVATSSGFTSKTVTNGTFDADDVVYTTPASGSTVVAVIIYIDTGVAGTSKLLSYHDTGTGLPFTTNGGNINIVWNGSGIIVLS